MVLETHLKLCVTEPDITPWDMGQNVLRQSDCRIFQSTISEEQINEIA